MPLNYPNWLATLSKHAAATASPRRCVVAFSGGRDSTVLLSLMAQAAPALNAELLAVHVNHRLQAAADDWQRHCEREAARLGVNFRALVISDAATGNAGPEGNARAARYRALTSLLNDGDWLLTGHHRDDQAETLLLQLMRGSGVDGLRGIAECRPLGAAFLLRPLLSCSAAEIEVYGHEQRLKWLEDPSNQDQQFDRNFLRAEVLPLLKQRWPAASAQLATSANYASEAAALIEELAAMDLDQCGEAARLQVSSLVGLSAARQANLLRHACRVLQLPPPPRRQLDAILGDLVPARPDAEPLVAWQGAEARRYRDHVYLLSPIAADPLAPTSAVSPGTSLALGTGLGELSLQNDGAGGIQASVADAGMTVRFRTGGEQLRPVGRGTGKTLKKLLQEAGVVPWQRPRMPLLYSGDTLVAIADLWIAEEFFAGDGYRVIWDNKPAIV